MNNLNSFSRVRFFITLGVFFLLNSSLLFSAAANKDIYEVSFFDLLTAMQSQTGYDPTATTNVARFQAQVVLLLAREAHSVDPQGPPLLIKHDNWFQAFLQMNNLSRETAPTFARLAVEYEQDLWVDYNSEHVIKEIKEGGRPHFAVNVTSAWPKTNGLPSKYSFEDTLSKPKLKVTNKNLITYRLLDFGDMIVYDQIKGLTGRPTSGVLAVLFKFIGEGRVVQSRMAITEDGLQICRVHAKKSLFGVKTTVTVQPDGETEKGLPEGRPDLIALEERLKEPIKIIYSSINNNWH